MFTGRNCHEKNKNRKHQNFHSKSRFSVHFGISCFTFFRWLKRKEKEETKKKRAKIIKYLCDNYTRVEESTKGRKKREENKVEEFTSNKEKFWNQRCSE